MVYHQRDLTANKLKISAGISASTRTIQKYLKLLGWKKRKTGFCQFVSYKNRIERVVYAKTCQKYNENFNESVFIDESTIQTNRNGNMQWHRKIRGETRNGLVGRYKHEASVHVIGGISRKGPTNLIIFKGNMKSVDYQRLLRRIKESIEVKYPIYYKLHMDNAPTHTSRTTTAFIDNNDINHFITPPQSPDLNPIELVWHDMKDYLAKEIKPRNILQLVTGIKQFWRNKVNVSYCNKKIDHVANKVLKTIIAHGGIATGM
jgi:transposase